MHSVAWVVVPADTTLENYHNRIADLIAAWDENDGENETGEWDWWQLGGRWTGRWSGYDPAKDPANHKPCRLCEGTGLRTDPIGREFREKHPDYTCNGCSDGPRPGISVEWPTSWKEHAGDLIAGTDLSFDGQLPYTVVVGGRWINNDPRDDERWRADLRILLAGAPMVAVVDYHS